jgi:benzoate/toluate 1,2-dioxygenase reductase subunit
MHSGDEMTVRDDRHLHTVALSRRRRLAPGTLELHFGRPEGFTFKPGQKITLVDKDLRRDYSLVNAPLESDLSICVRLVPGGKLTPVLDRAECGKNFLISPPFGFFLFQSAHRRAVFVATGTGVAPFVAYVRSGVRAFHLLHGVSSERHLYYADELRNAADAYTPCISGMRSASPGADGPMPGASPITSRTAFPRGPTIFIFAAAATWCGMPPGSSTGNIPIQGSLPRFSISTTLQPQYPGAAVAIVLLIIWPDSAIVHCWFAEPLQVVSP